MNTFHDLWQTPTRSGADPFAPDRRSDVFPELVARNSRLHLWEPDAPIPSTGRRLLIGVATWSGYDMALLDLLGQETVSDSVRIEVFDTAQCHSQADFDRIIPGIGRVFHTPVVGLWVDGVLTENASGAAGRDLVARVCGLDPAQVQQRMASIYQQT
jgi:hypothetical protein